MGQQLSSIDLKIDVLAKTNAILSCINPEDVDLFLPLETVNGINVGLFSQNDRDEQSSIGRVSRKQSLIKQIRTGLFHLTNPSELSELNTQIAGRIEQVLDHIKAIDTSIMKDIQSIQDKENQLQISYTEKAKESFVDSYYYENPLIDLQTEVHQLSLFTVQSSISILLILIKSSEKNDPTIVHQILKLTSQLVEQIPMNYIFSDVCKPLNGLFKSLTPLTNYINELSLETEIDPYASKQAIQILLSFSIVKASFKDILPLLNKLILNTTDIYDIRKLFIKLNNYLTENIDELEKETQFVPDTIVTIQEQRENAHVKQFEDDDKISKKMKETVLITKTTDVDRFGSMALKYLQSIKAFPNTKLMELNEKNFSGQFVSSILLSHIDIHNILHSKSQFEHGSLDSSFSFEFHPNTFQQLFHLIEQLTTEDSSYNTTIIYMLTVCLRLFRTHLHFLIRSNLQNFHVFETDDDFEKFFTLILKLSLDNQSEEISKEASKTLIDLLNKQTSSFSDKLSFIHKYIIENKHLILIEQLIIELRNYPFLQKWIDILCNDNKTSACTILHSFIDICVESNSIQEQNPLENVLLMFQELLLIRLNNQTSDITDEFEPSPSLSDLVVKYATHIITYCTSKSVDNDLLKSLLLGLYTLTEFKFNFITIQPIFIEMVPLLAEYLLKATDTKDETNVHLISVLLGKMSHRLIDDLPQSTWEKKYDDILKSSLFAGGCETELTQNSPRLLNLFNSNLTIYSQFELTSQKEELSSDRDFLMSIYNNINQGAELISKMKTFVGDHQQVLQTSIEQQANDACAAVFAVYIKYYHQIDLAKNVLSQSIDKKAHNKLLSIYQYANHVKTLFATNEIPNDHPDELCKQIKMNALVLLESVKENDLISIIEEDQSLENNINTYLYGYNISTLLLTSEENKIQSDQLIKCLLRQHERAMTRLITYRFIHTFINKLIQTKDEHRIHIILPIYLSYTKNVNFNWHYLDNISASNIHLKENIRESYYAIIKTVTLLAKSTMERMLVLTLFNFINIPYDSIDLCYLHRLQLIETLFTSFVTFFQTDSILTGSLDMKLSGYNWFRTFVLQLCEITQFDTRTFDLLLKQQRDFVFCTLILSELNKLIILRQTLNLTEECQNSSLNDAAIGWFIAAAAANDIDLYINQLLMLLLRCIHLYDHVRSLCATDHYIEQLLNIYDNSQHRTTHILLLKILRDLLPLLPENTNSKMNPIIEKLLIDILFYIGDNSNPHRTMNTSPDITNEFIDIYRTLMSQHSPWQRKVTKMVIDSVESSLTFNLQSLESIETRQMNFFLASLCILGGYIRPYSLGSLVQFYTNNQLESAIIIEIDTNTEQSNTLSYCIQSVVTNKIEWIMVNKLYTVTDVVPPSLMLLPTDEGLEKIIHFVLDTLAYLAQIDTSTTESLILLQIKRRSLAIFYSLLNNKQMVDIFMEKSYASIIAKLSISSANILNKFDLEQYSLALDMCERTKATMEDEHQVSTVWNHMKIIRDPLILKAISTNILKYNGWKPYASKIEIESFQQGRMGNDQIKIVPLPADHRISELEECGNIHKYKGRINIADDDGVIFYPTFILEDVQLTEGKWYYCARILSDGPSAIGWASRGFNPYPSYMFGMGIDEYSWGYIGSHRECGHNRDFTTFCDEIRWKEGDVCGCGIEIDGENTIIKYWLNGQPMGTAFSHTSNTINESTKQCNMLPHGPNTTYFPSISLQVSGNFLNKGVCEFIFSPEDMVTCPLPEGYKPLLIPTLINIENSLVAYPFSAYLVGNDIEDYFHTVRRSYSDTKNGNDSFLRDFVNEHHFEVPFTIVNDDHLLNISNDSNGLFLSLDNHQSMTISFDFELLESNQDQIDIILIAFENNLFPVRILMNKFHDEFLDETIPNRKRIAIVFKSNEQTKIYVNNEYQIFDIFHKFDPKTKTKLNLNILPHVAAGIKNIGVWNYALSEEHIRRLFIYSLSYVANDYQIRKKYRKQANIFTFEKEQQYFINELLVPFNQPFEENIWKNKKKQADHDESIYFKTILQTHQSTVQLFGNQTYLVLNTSDNLCSEYTLIIDIFVPNFRINNHSQLTLITLNTQSQIYITHDGHLCISGEEKSASSFKFNEYIRLLISLQKKYLKIYLNGILQLNVLIADDQFNVKFGHVDLFRETDLIKNTTSEDQLRIECKSIAFFKKPIDPLSPLVAKLIKSTEYSLEKLIDPPFSMLSFSLIAIGYNQQWIKFAIEHYNTHNIQFIDTILRELNEETLKTYLDEQCQHKNKIINRLTPFIDNERLEDLIMHDEEVTGADRNTTETEKQWFNQSIHDLNIQEKFSEWIRDKNPMKRLMIEDCQCLTENILQKKLEKSIEYYSQKQYFNLRQDCEYRLTTIYARHLILNIFKIWLRDNHPTLFPLDKFGDATFIVTLLRSMNFHYKYTRTPMDETIDRVRLITISILKNELTELLKITVQDSSTNEILKTKAPLTYQLQKYLFEQSIEFLIEPSLLEINNNNDQSVNEQILITEANLEFFFKTVNLFLELIIDNSMQQHQIDLIISALFPSLLIKMMYDIFLLVPSHQLKIFILHLFSTLIRRSDNFHLNENIEDFVLKLWIELITNQTLINNLTLKNLRIALMDLSFVLLKKDTQILYNLVQCSDTASNQFTYVGQWSTPEEDMIFKFKIILKIKGEYNEQTQTVPIEGWVLWTLIKVPEHSFLANRLGHSAREFVEGTFNRNERQMKFHGVMLDSSAIRFLALDNYKITLTEDGQQFQGLSAGNSQLWNNIIRGKTEQACRRETIEENIKIYHQNIELQPNYSLLLQTDAILLNI